jgi:hypothetical protein
LEILVDDVPSNDIEITRTIEIDTIIVTGAGVIHKYVGYGFYEDYAIEEVVVDGVVRYSVGI